MTDVQPTSPEEWKAKGNTAFAVKEWDTAVHCYTKALETGHEQPWVCLGNRSAANLQLEFYAAAVTDAEECTKLKPTYWKGWSRLGAALRKQNGTRDPEEAYQSGLAVVTDDVGRAKLQNELEKIRSRKQGASSGSGADGGGSRDAVAGGGFLSRLPVYIQMFCILNALLFLLPIGGMSRASFRFVLIGSIVKYILALSVHGRPKFSSDYAMKIGRDMNLHYLGLSFILMSARPQFMALVPLVTPDMYHVAVYLTRTSPGLAATLGKVVKPASRFIYNTDSLAMLSGRIMTFSTWCEIALGIVMLVEMLTPYRNFLSCVLMWQYIRTRYMLFSDMKYAFAQLNAKVSPYLQRVPIVGRLWDMIKKGAAWLVKLPEPGQQRSSCSIQ